MDSYNSPTTKPLFRGVQIVWYVLSVLEVLLAFRFVLKMTGANPGSGFASFIYNATYMFVQPFNTVFRMTRIEGSVLEWTTLLAMLVYLLVGWGIVQLFFMSKTVSTPEAAVALNNKETV
jgi:YGGT family